MSDPTSRRRLLELARRNRSYEFLQAAMPRLEQDRDDHELRLLTVSQFARLGLFGPAIEMVDDHPSVLADAPELGATIEPLRCRPSDGVSWESCTRRFERNLERACNRFESCRGLAERITRSLVGLDLHRCADGNFLLSRRTGRGPRRWLPSIINWADAVAQLSVLPGDANTLCHPYALEGLAFGHLLRKIYDGTSKMFLTYRPRIHAFEPNLAQFAVWLSIADQRDILSDERFLLWLGPQGAEAFLDFCRARPAELRPANVIRQPGWGPAMTRIAAPAVEQINAESDTRIAQFRSTIETRLSDRDAAYYAQRFENRKSRPLRILGITSRFTTFLQYSMRDIRHAAEALGHEFCTLIEENDHTPSLTRDYILSHIERFDPDLILIIDHNRKEFGDAYDFKIPFCNWIQDDLVNLFGPGRGENLHPFDLVVGTIGHWRARASGYPDGQWRHLRTPVSLRTFTNEPVGDSDRRACACEVSFVTNLSITAEQFLAQQRAATAQPEMRRLLEALYEDMGPRIAAGNAPASPVQTIGLTRELARRIGLEITRASAETIRQGYTERLINIFFRHQVLQWAAEMGLDLHIYGRGWENHPTLAKYARGVAEHGYHLRCVFQATKLNIQAYPITAAHQRLLEGLASGGFFVIRKTVLDGISPLLQRVEQRCVEFDIRTEEQLWNASDAQLHADVRKVNDLLWAPERLYDGYVADLRQTAVEPHRYEVGALLPHYDEVSFSTREDFEQVARRFLNAPEQRASIAAAQRESIVNIFSYEAAVERILDFAASYFRSVAGAPRAAQRAVRPAYSGFSDGQAAPDR